MPNLVNLFFCLRVLHSLMYPARHWTFLTSFLFVSRCRSHTCVPFIEFVWSTSKDLFIWVGLSLLWHNPCWYGLLFWIVTQMGLWVMMLMFSNRSCLSVDHEIFFFVVNVLWRNGVWLYLLSDRSVLEGIFLNNSGGRELAKWLPCALINKPAPGHLRRSSHQVVRDILHQSRHPKRFPISPQLFRFFSLPYDRFLW
jgi:hypothetical protein